MRRVRGDMLCATLYAGGWTLFAGGVGEVQDVSGRMKEGMRRVLLCMLEVAEGELCLLEAMHCVLLCMLEAVENGLWIQFRGFEISILWQFSRYIPRPCMANPSRTPPHHSE